MKLIFTEGAWKEYVYWQEQDKKTLKRINRILQEIERDRFGGIAKPEPLRGNYSGCFSRRVDDTNRILYRVKEDAIEIIQCRGHYGDK